MECSIDDNREGCTCTYEPREKMKKSNIERTAERGS